MDKEQIVKDAKERLTKGGLGSKRVAALAKLSTELSKIPTALEELKKSEGKKQILEKLGTINDSLKALKEISKVDSLDAKLVAINNTLQSLEVSPNVTVKPATVKVPAIDVTPIQEQIDRLLTKEVEETIDLSCYYCQDTSEPVSGQQYFGFVDVDGKWYILWNNSTEGQLRYAFGIQEYNEAWGPDGLSAPNHTFLRLDEAVKYAAEG